MTIQYLFQMAFSNTFSNVVELTPTNFSINNLTLFIPEGVGRGTSAHYSRVRKKPSNIFARPCDHWTNEPVDFSIIPKQRTFINNSGQCIYSINYASCQNYGLTTTCTDFCRCSWQLRLMAQHATSIQGTAESRHIGQYFYEATVLRTIDSYNLMFSHKIL